MGKNATPIRLNLGAGLDHQQGFVSVDAFGDPDVKHDLNKAPYPWKDNTIDGIIAFHVFEHLIDWWPAFTECARILKPGGSLEIRVPDESSGTALTWRDHHHVFGLVSFHGTMDADHGTNAWAKTVKDSVPLKLESYHQVPYKEYEWMLRFPRILGFCARHMRNFIHEQRFIFRKVGK